jgi:hypothetical protein
MEERLPITRVLQDAGLKEILENFQKIPAKNFSIFQFFRNFKKWKKFLLALGHLLKFQLQ